MMKKMDKNISGMQAESFDGHRLKIAREFRGLTQTELACQIAASDSLISLCEIGKKADPAPDLVDACAQVLGFRSSFFYAKLDDPFSEAECSFRHKRSASIRLKDQIRAHGTLIGLVVSELRKVLKFPSLNVPNFAIADVDDIDKAAEKSRDFWELDADGPIHQIGRVLERAGVVIVSHVVDSNKVDAFSRCGATSVIFLNKAIKSSSRWNFDIAHECGHLVLHKGRQTGCVETEAQADRYASAFMMPRRAFSREFRAAKFSWDHIFELKSRWRMSAAAIVRRAYDLGLIDAVTYRKAYKHMAFKGWIKGEPHEPVFQEPELLSSALVALRTGARGLRFTLADVCKNVGLLPRTFKDVTGFDIPTTGKGSSGVIQFPARKIV